MKLIEVSGLLTFTLAILVFFLGAGVNDLVPALRRWNIPKAVTGGLIAALATFAAYSLFGVEIVFTLGARDLLLLYFFTGIGLNARLSDLVAGGRPLLILLGVTLVYLVLQNLIAAGAVAALGLPKGVTALVGSASLIGGHGTTIAWAPIINARFGLDNAMEIGVAAATLGLVIASLIGGPVAGVLIKRYGLAGSTEAAPVVGLPDEDKSEDISHVSFLRALLVLNVVILIGSLGHEALAEAGVRMPRFVVCLLVAILFTNIVPALLPRLEWPSRGRSLALISDISLNVFLVMSLMSMQLWTLGGLGPALAAALAVQTLVAVLYMLFVVFPAMGRTYEAAVIAAGFGGISLGATPTAIANMTAVAAVHGAAPIAFIILPLVSAFFIDIANAGAIGFLVR
ncbi:sodium/glutamate symporter [Methylocella sp.]|uniref:sodium/glutamate symporter n=1 Tax=Methylocella sp. TaxID=1978226 RepID=UPI003784B43B